jgi:hypothetical protein
MIQSTKQISFHEVYNFEIEFKTRFSAKHYFLSNIWTPLAPKVAGSNPAEAVGFLRAEKSSPRLPSEGK